MRPCTCRRRARAPGAAGRLPPARLDVTLRGTARGAPRGRRDARARRYPVRRRCACPGTRRVTSRSPRTAASSRATCSSPAPSAAPTAPGGDWETLLESIRMLLERFPPETIVYSGPRPGDDARAASSRRTRSSPSSGPRPVKIEAPRGTHDVLPAEQPAPLGPDRARPTTSRARYGYGLDRDADVRGHRALRRDVGRRLGRRAEGDVHVRRPGGRSLTLRPEGTAPVARAYLEHGLHREPQPVKTYYVGPMFRYAAPQKGRYREFWQIGVRGDGLGRPGGRRRADPALRRASSAAPASRTRGSS